MKQQDILSLCDQVGKSGTRFVVVTGGVCSSIGKGVLISSIGTLLQNAGHSVSVMKCDPYLNVDPGTMSPLEHGEVFVTHDGGETDLDLGHYERTLGVHLTKNSSITSGKVYQRLLSDERAGNHLGKCIQVIPHVTDEIQRRILQFALDKQVDVVLIEIGGTVGDIEIEIFLESIRQLRTRLPQERVALCHLSLVPYLPWARETKMKPTQHSVMQLKKAGLLPDMLFLRTERDITDKQRSKVAVMCGMSQETVMQVRTHYPMYSLFQDLADQGVHKILQEHLGFVPVKDADLSKWHDLLSRIEESKDKKIKIALIAKYVGGNDPYISLVEALKSAGFAAGVSVELVTIDAEELEQGTDLGHFFTGISGIVIPGGFSNRGTEGKIAAIGWARENNVPLFGICLGMQMLLVEAARSLLGLSDAHSVEMNPDTQNPIISMIDEQCNITKKGGTMRLGAYACQIVPGTKTAEAYGSEMVYERHRHRYEFNNAYKQQLESVGIVFTGTCPDNGLVEAVEVEGHPFMAAVQFHPEYCSTPLRPHPLIAAFVVAAVEAR